MDGYDYIITPDEEGIAMSDTNEELYKGPPDSPEIDEIININEEER